MFDLSFSELLLIALVCIIFLKPEDLPGILRSAGRLFGKIKNFSDEIKNSIMLEETPKKTKILGLDGKYHDAYDVKEVFKDMPQTPAVLNEDPESEGESDMKAPTDANKTENKPVQ